MKVEAIYINTHRYDFDLAKICIASVRYWYPDIPVFLIRDLNNGNFSFSTAAAKWGVKAFATKRKKMGWGFGKLEPLFQNEKRSFLVLDADTVLTGPVLNTTAYVNADFIVDEEVQPAEKIKLLYYDLARIGTIDAEFKFPGYNFNTGQWFGTSGIISRNDFDGLINWTEPPAAKFPDIIFQGEQGHLNYMLQKKQQGAAITLARKKIMIWPSDGAADFIDLDKIRQKKPAYPFVIHWAGMKFSSLKEYPRGDLLAFYMDYYYSRTDFVRKWLDKCRAALLPLERKFRQRLKK